MILIDLVPFLLLALQFLGNGGRHIVLNAEKTRGLQNPTCDYVIM